MKNPPPQNPILGSFELVKQGEKNHSYLLRCKSLTKNI